MNTIPLALPDLDEDDVRAVGEVVRSGQLSLGPRVPAFEGAIAAYAGARRAVAVSSGTAALHLAVRALGIGPGDEVVTTPFSFIASANAALFEGAAPVFADIHPETWDLDPDAAAAAVTGRTRALLPVHVFGRPAPMDRYAEIAGRRGLAVIEDAAEALGTRLAGGRMAGTAGRAGVYAFYPNKQMTTGEGGIVVTDDDALADDAAARRNQGRGAGGWLHHDRLGYNYRLSDLHAALGISQLGKLERFIAERERVAALYAERLAALPEVVLPPPVRGDARISRFVYVVRLGDGFDQEARDAVLEGLASRGIGCRDYFAPIHLQPFYRERFGFAPGAFPVTEAVAARTLALPFWNRMTEGHVDQVVAALGAVLGGLRTR